MEFKQPKICRICGAEFLPHNSNQRFCDPECQKQGNRERVKRHYYATKKIKTFDEKIDRKIEIGQRKLSRHEDPNTSLNDVAKLAAAAHMTYGQYVMKYNI